MSWRIDVAQSASAEEHRSPGFTALLALIGIRFGGVFPQQLSDLRAFSFDLREVNLETRTLRDPRTELSG